MGEKAIEIKKTNSKYSPEYTDILIEGMSEGLGVRAIAGKIGVSYKTLYNWIEKYPEMKEAFEIGQGKSRLFWESSGINIMLGNIRGNPIIWINSMANKFKDWNRDGSSDAKVEIKLAYDPRKKKAKKKED